MNEGWYWSYILKNVYVLLGIGLIIKRQKKSNCHKRYNYQYPNNFIYVFIINKGLDWAVFHLVKNVTAIDENDPASRWKLCSSLVTSTAVEYVNSIQNWAQR